MTRERIILFGAGPLGLNAAHIIRKAGEYTLVGFIDSKTGPVADIPILGNDSLADSLLAEGVRHAAVSIGNNQVRCRVARALKEKGFLLPALVHPGADVGLRATIGEGSIVFANAFIGPETTIGPFCVIEAQALIGHHVTIAEGVLVSPRALVENAATIPALTVFK